MRESLMLMRLVKCYLMELFNQSRVERQLARYAQAQLRPLPRRGDLPAAAGPARHAVRRWCCCTSAGVIVLRRPAGRGRHGRPGDGAGQPVLAAGELAGARRAAAPRPGVGRARCSSSWSGAARSARWSAPSSCRRWPSSIEFDNVSLREPGSGADAAGGRVADHPGRQAHRPGRRRRPGEARPGLPDPAPARPDLAARSASTSTTCAG